MDINNIQKIIDENLLQKIIKIDKTIKQVTYYETDDYNKYILVCFEGKASLPIHVTEELNSYKAIEEKVINVLIYTNKI